MHPPADNNQLNDVAPHARQAYAACVAGECASHWWTAVIITASSQRQAERYEAEIRRRRESGHVPAGVTYLVVPDLDDERIGSGGATLNALRVLAEHSLPGAVSLEEWWTQQRVFIIHSGGDSRRLPQYSLSGKLFSALPVKTPWGGVSAVFDEMLALSTAWVEKLDSGLVVASGDVILTFDAAELHWDTPGVRGVAMREPVAVGSKHGVYITDEQGRVYSFLQKPTATQVSDAGGMLPGDEVALDTGLIRFDAAISARLSALAGVDARQGKITDGILARTAAGRPNIDLYEHMTLALTGQWAPAEGAEDYWIQLADALRGLPFWCDCVAGEFTHIGSTTLFRKLMTEETNFTRLYEAQQRLGNITIAGLHSTGVIVDSVFAGGGELGLGSIAIECSLRVPIHAERGAILHGLSDLPLPVHIPADTVVHQIPIALPDGRHGVIIRVYAVDDDPKGTVTEGATWLGVSFLERLQALGIEPEMVWPDIADTERTLWNACLFPLGSIADAWDCARWFMADNTTYTVEKWQSATKQSLAESAKWADGAALAEAHTRRLQTSWQLAAVALAEAGSDIRPLLAAPPGIIALSTAGRDLEKSAAGLKESKPTEAASRHYMASFFLGHSGLMKEATAARASAFACVHHGVELGIAAGDFAAPGAQWVHAGVNVSAPIRVDFGGGWSDTPPFCLDWGGTVLNIALSLNEKYPIITRIRRINEPIVRCISLDSGDRAEYSTTEEIFAPLAPGDSLALSRVAVQLSGVLANDIPLVEALTKMGGGIEISTEVDLPMGSGLGTSSILAVTIIRALAQMLGTVITPAELFDQVMRLEQRMTTGGGWQDQAGGLFPGAKLLTTGPGLRQHIRVQPLEWTPERRTEFTDRFVLYYTGIRRIAKNLLTQVVGSYLAREVATVQVLHSIKTLANEMAYALREGEWSYLGELLDRHWELNLIMDPNMTNAPINALLQEVRPYLAGAKLAGAGGGGFLLLLARDANAAKELRQLLAARDGGGQIYEYEIADAGLQVEAL